jgi:hypothetical protein
VPQPKTPKRLNPMMPIHEKPECGIDDDWVDEHLRSTQRYDDLSYSLRVRGLVCQEGLEIDKCQSASYGLEITM